MIGLFFIHLANENPVIYGWDEIRASVNLFLSTITKLTSRRDYG